MKLTGAMFCLLCGPAAAQSISDLDALQRAISLVFPMIGPGAGLPAGVSADVTTYLAKISSAVSQSLTIINGSGDDVTNGAAIAALFAGINPPSIPSQYAAIGTAIQQVAILTSQFLSTLSAGNPPVTVPSGVDANFVGAGGSYQPQGSPLWALTAIYSRAVNASGSTQAYTVYDALPTSTNPLTFSNNIGVGIAERMPFSLGPVTVYLPASAGPSWTGTNLGWAWSAGALLHIQLGTSHWSVNPAARMVKSSISGSGYGVIASVLIGIGW